MRFALPLMITSTLPSDIGHIPISLEIDFAELIDSHDLGGVFDPNSIVVVNLIANSDVPFSRTEDFTYSDSGRVEWVITDPTHTRYEIRFDTVAERPPLELQAYTPLVGVGDLLRYNAGVPRPITLGYSMKIVDVTSNGSGDLVGCWNYYHRPGSPISGVVCYPRMGSKTDFTFGDMARLRFRDQGSVELHHFEGVYQEADFADFTGNGLTDIVHTVAHTGTATFYLNTGERDTGGWPIYEKSQSIPVPEQQNGGICAIDLDEDGVLDLIINGTYIRNGNAEGWPFIGEEPVDLDLGRCVSPMDLTGDGRSDILYLKGGGCEQQLWWARRSGDRAFEETGPVDLHVESITQVTTTTDDRGPGILVQHNMYQNISLFRLAKVNADGPAFESAG